MTGAVRILGDQVGSAAPGFLAVLAVHVLAGLTAVISGAIAALSTKGGRRHVRAGRWFCRAITVVFTTAAVLAVMRWRQDYPLLAVGTVAYAAATAGYLHRRLRRPGDAGHIVGMGAGYTAMLTAFYVDNGPHLPLWDHLPPLAFWLLPSTVAAPLIGRALIRARRSLPGEAPRCGAQNRFGGSMLPGGRGEVRVSPQPGLRAPRSARVGTASARVSGAGCRRGRKRSSRERQAGHPRRE